MCEDTFVIEKHCACYATSSEDAGFGVMLITTLRPATNMVHGSTFNSYQHERSNRAQTNALSFQKVTYTAFAQLLSSKQVLSCLSCYC